MPEKIARCAMSQHGRAISCQMMLSGKESKSVFLNGHTLIKVRKLLTMLGFTWKFLLWFHFGLFRGEKVQV